MASRRIENKHITGINKILSVSGLECIRSPPISMTTSSDSGELEEIGELPSYDCVLWLGRGFRTLGRGEEFILPFKSPEKRDFSQSHYESIPTRSYII